MENEPDKGLSIRTQYSQSPQLLDSVQCNASTRHCGPKPPASKRRNTLATKSLHSNYAMACSSFLRTWVSFLGF